ncbi:MAG: hypothetical protein ABIR32_22185 [Ilumatobacteraceae bacterium]
MLQFRVAGEVTRLAIANATRVSAGSTRRLLGAGAGMLGELVSELTSSRPGGEVYDNDVRTPRWVTDLGDAIWKGSVKVAFEDVETIAAVSHASVDGSTPVAIGGDRTTITGNLSLYEHEIVFSPHESWQRRGIDVIAVHTDQPIEVSGMTEGDGGRRALVINLRGAGTKIVFRLGVLNGKLAEIIADRLG